MLADAPRLLLFARLRRDFIKHCITAYIVNAEAYASPVYATSSATYICHYFMLSYLYLSHHTRLVKKVVTGHFHYAPLICLAPFDRHYSLNTELLSAEMLKIDHQEFPFRYVIVLPLRIELPSSAQNSIHSRSCHFQDTSHFIAVWFRFSLFLE